MIERKVLGKDVEVGKFYKSPKGNLIKVINKVDFNGNLEVFAVSPTDVVVKVPANIELVECPEGASQFTVSSKVAEKSIKKKTVGAPNCSKKKI